MNTSAGPTPELGSLTFDPHAVGWMTCTLHPVVGDPLSLEASHVSDVLSHVLGMARSILTDASRVACLVLHREPEGSIVTCVSRAGHVALTVTSSEDGVTHHLASTPARLADIIEAGVAGIDREACRARWPEHLFPEDDLERLREMRILMGPGSRDA